MGKLNMNLIDQQSRLKSGNNVQIDNIVGDVEVVFTEQDIARLYQAKCEDLKIKMYPVQFMRFRDCVNKICLNRKCNFSDMYLGPLFAAQLGSMMQLDKFAVLNLSKNNIGDKGVEKLTQFLRVTRTLVSLNLSSNEISGAGFGHIFEAMKTNESVIELDLSTYEGVNRNRLPKKVAGQLKEMLIQSPFLEILKINGIHLGNEGMSQIAKAFCYGLDEALRLEREREMSRKGEFIRSGAGGPGKASDADKDFSILPEMKTDQADQ